MPVKNKEIELAIEKFLEEEDLFLGHGKRAATKRVLMLRNLMVVCAVVLFLLSFRMAAYAPLRAAGYIFGALAYVLEILVLTDCFQTKIPHNELFMPYCFGPLYIIMGIGYLAA